MLQHTRSLQTARSTQITAHASKQTLSRPATSVVSASDPNAIRITFKAGWRTGVVHGSLAGSPWKDYSMEATGGAHRCTLSITSDQAHALSTGATFEFVLNNTEGSWEKCTDGGNFSINKPGNFLVKDGKTQPVSPGPAVMVVSDLDGTMVGDDSATSAFRQWWDSTAFPRGGILVYNTGRSLESFEGLAREKAHCLARPDVLISAVGTKVYELQHGQWVEDAGWTSALDQGWELGAARDACYRALAQVGKELMHFRPANEQNGHKVTCGIAVSAIQTVLDAVGTELSAKGVQHQCITSGHGDWRFMDLVPQNAGKLAALDYVRQQYGFPLHATVACGDSGNDILMLQGENLAIVVSNAQPDLKEWYETQPAGTGPEGKSRLLMTSKAEAFGILEGLAYWGLQ